MDWLGSDPHGGFYSETAGAGLTLMGPQPTLQAAQGTGNDYLALPATMIRGASPNLVLAGLVAAVIGYGFWTRTINVSI